MDGIQAAGRAQDHHGHYAEMLKKFDTNNDGKIDADERKAGMERMRARGGHHRHHAQESEVATSNGEAAQSAGNTGGTGAHAGQYGPEGQAPNPGQPTLDVTV